MDEYILEDYAMGENVFQITFSVEQEDDVENVGGTPDSIITKDVTYNVIGEVTGIYPFCADSGVITLCILEHLDLAKLGFQEVINGKTVFTLFKDDMMAKARELFDGEIE